MIISTATYESIADLPPGLLPSALAVGVALIALHVWLSRKNPVWLGAIVPAAYIALALAISSMVAPDGGLITGYVTCFVALLAIWWAGEGTRKKRRGGGESIPDAAP